MLRGAHVRVNCPHALTHFCWSKNVHFQCSGQKVRNKRSWILLEAFNNNWVGCGRLGENSTDRKHVTKFQKFIWIVIETWGTTEHLTNSVLLSNDVIIRRSCEPPQPDDKGGLQVSQICEVNTNIIAKTRLNITNISNINYYCIKYSMYIYIYIYLH